MYQCLENSCVIVCSLAKSEEAKKQKETEWELEGEWKGWVIKIYGEIRVDGDGGHVQKERVKE